MYCNNAEHTKNIIDTTLSEGLGMASNSIYTQKSYTISVQTLVFMAGLFGKHDMILYTLYIYKLTEITTEFTTIFEWSAT